MAGYRIREVDGDECELEIKALHKLCFDDEAPQPNPAEEGWWWLVYREVFPLEGSAFVPVAFAGMKSSFQTENCMYLHRSGVLPEDRGNGLQRRLIRVREAKARKMGYGYLVSDTTDNPESANNLIRAGFRIYRPDLKYGFVNTIYWRKKLDCSKRRNTGRKSGAARATEEVRGAAPQSDDRAAVVGSPGGDQGPPKVLLDKPFCGCRVECVPGCFWSHYRY